MDFNTLDTSRILFGRKISAPIFISSMTGGTNLAEGINLNLLQAAADRRIPFAMGSMRIYLEQNRFEELKKYRNSAPEIPILANIGAVQLNYGVTVDHLQKIIDSIEADALILHLNPIQEVFQSGGNVNFSGLLRRIEKIRKQLSIPLVIKEVGFGYSVSTAGKLRDCGIDWLDIAGAGGTSWVKVEALRNLAEGLYKTAEPFFGWGVPTAISLERIHKAYPAMNLIASGGIRDGIEMVKAEMLGAVLSGIALPLLKPAQESGSAVCEVIDRFVFQYRAARFCSSGIESI